MQDPRMASMDVTHTAQLIVLSARMKALEEALDSIKGAPGKCQRNERIRELVCHLLDDSQKHLADKTREQLQREVERIVGPCDGD